MEEAQLSQEDGREAVLPLLFRRKSLLYQVFKTGKGFERKEEKS